MNKEALNFLKIAKEIIIQRNTCLDIGMQFRGIANHLYFRAKQTDPSVKVPNEKKSLRLIPNVIPIVQEVFERENAGISDTSLYLSVLPVGAVVKSKTKLMYGTEFEVKNSLSIVKNGKYLSLCIRTEDIREYVRKTHVKGSTTLAYFHLNGVKFYLPLRGYETKVAEVAQKDLEPHLIVEDVYFLPEYLSFPFKVDIETGYVHFERVFGATSLSDMEGMDKILKYMKGSDASRILIPTRIPAFSLDVK